MSGAVVLLSGGQDSTICLGWAKRMFGRPLVSLTIDYGQRHRRELHAARAVATHFGVDERRIIKIDLCGSIPSGLTEPRTEVAASGGIHDLPTTYVPGRNAVFLALAAGVAQVREIANVVIGCCAIDASGYPDCRESFLLAQQQTLRVGLEFPTLSIRAPVVDLSKVEALRVLALPHTETWEALAYSWTCYLGGPAPCGNCPSCKLRAKSFAEAGLKDPALHSTLEGDPNP